MRGRISFILLAMAFVAVGCAAPSDPGFERDQLERTEDLAESLANDLLAFSVAVRDGDREEMARFVADSIETTGLDLPLTAAEPLTAWIDQSHLADGAAIAQLDRAGFLDAVAAWRERFSEIDDARFKVVTSYLGDDEQSGDPKLKFFIVARNADGRREWWKGKLKASVVHDGEAWQLRKMVVDELTVKNSSVDLFSEVALPAGVAQRFPSFGEGRNEGFLYHGVAVADIDLDGILDVATTGVDANKLYRGRGDGTFEDISEASLVGFAPVGAGALFLDFDNDGDSDLFFAGIGPQMLFENRFIPDGELQFWDISEQARVDRHAVGFSAIAGDVNADGLPDIYVASYNRYGTVMPDSWVRAENGTPNLLFLNQGDGSFEEVGEAWGVADARWSYAAGMIDIDEDGDQDIYVANDFGENALYRNDGGRFTDAADAFGLRDPGFGMGVAFGDYDNDGDFDLHVTNMSSTAGNRILKLLYPEGHPIRETLTKQAAGNSLYANDGDGTFSDVTAELGGLSGGWGFGGGFVDFDNDGREDIYAPNGFVSGKSMKDT